MQQRRQVDKTTHASPGRPHLRVVGTFREQENEHARRYVRALMNRQFGGSQTALARALGVAQPTVGNFIAGKFGIGPKMLAGLRVITGAGEDEILGRGSRKAAEPDIPEDPRYPSRARAIVAARIMGLREEAIQATATTMLKGRAGVDYDPGVEYWMEDMLHNAKQLAHEDESA